MPYVTYLRVSHQTQKLQIDTELYRKKLEFIYKHLYNLEKMKARYRSACF